MLFEQEFPEAGAILGELCHERGLRKQAGMRNKPIVLNPPEPMVAGKKTGRNDPCPCGSGKKFKKCCLQ